MSSPPHMTPDDDAEASKIVEAITYLNNLSVQFSLSNEHGTTPSNQEVCLYRDHTRTCVDQCRKASERCVQARASNDDDRVRAYGEEVKWHGFGGISASHEWTAALERQRELVELVYGMIVEGGKALLEVVDRTGLRGTGKYLAEELRALLRTMNTPDGAEEGVSDEQETDQVSNGGVLPGGIS